MFKPFILIDIAVLGMVGAVSADGTAEKVILYGGAIGALGLFWRTFGRPAVAILKRTASAVDSLETLPRWREEHDERLSDLEAEVGLAIPAIGAVQNDVSAIRRELGITDSDVRQPPPPPRAEAADRRGA